MFWASTRTSTIRARFNRAKSKPVARPLRKTKEKWHLLKGNEIGYVIAKAVLLLALCWIVGAARYVPSFVEVFGFNLLPF